MDIGVVGASGRMGQVLIRLIGEAEDLRLVGVSDRADSALVGMDVGEALGGRELGVRIEADPVDAFKSARAIVDFSSPEATIATANLAAQTRAIHVIGTTGLDEGHLKSLKAAARHAVIIRSGNMSLGVNLLASLVRQAARALGPDYDIEIIEAHHRHKVDAPSGTALLLGEAAASGRGVSLSEVSDRGRDGITGARKEGDIGFSAIRGGEIIGEHKVLLAGPSERIELGHVASDRALFATGALRAARWGVGQPPGEYDMSDVLGLRPIHA